MRKLLLVLSILPALASAQTALPAAKVQFHALLPECVANPNRCVAASDYNALLERMTALQVSTVEAYTGTGTGTTGAPRLRLGSGTPMAPADDSAILVLRTLTGDSLFSHAVRDETSFNTTTTGAYASFDSIPAFSGTIHYNHLHSFQSRPAYSGSGIIDEIAAFTYQLNAISGTVSNSYGMRVMDAQGSGAITNQYGIWIDPLTRGTNNYALYSGSTTVSSYHGGVFQFGTPPRMSASGWTTYGALVSHDATGNLITNPYLTIINGTLTMAQSTAKVNASAALLELASASARVKLTGAGYQFTTSTLGTCGAAGYPEGTLVTVAGTGGTRTKWCGCTYDGTTYAWMNLATNNAGTGVGTTTTCP